MGNMLTFDAAEYIAAGGRLHNSPLLRWIMNQDECDEFGMNREARAEAAS